MAGPGATVTRLTAHGFTVGGPRFGPDGTLYYSVVNPHGFPALLARAPGAVAPRKVADRYLGTHIGFAGSALVFDRMEIERQVGLQSDLYVMDGAGGGPERLTHGARAGDPDVSPDGRVIVCTIQRDDRRELATLPYPSARTARAQPRPLRCPAAAAITGARRWISSTRRRCPTAIACNCCRRSTLPTAYSRD